MLKVNEIFHSIQGESTYAGWPCAFIRLAWCNLRCDYCDTVYAYQEGEDMSVTEIMEKVSSYDVKLAEITGGEPLLQDETPALAQALIDKGYKTLIETPAVATTAVTLYQFALTTVYQVLKQDFTLIEKIQLKLTSDFLNSVSRENAIEEPVNN